VVVDSGEVGNEWSAKLREDWEAHVALLKERRLVAEDRIWKIAEEVSDLQRSSQDGSDLERKVLSNLPTIADLGTSSVYQIGEFIDSLSEGLSEDLRSTIEVLKLQIMLQAFLNMPVRRGVVPYGGSELDLVALVSEVEPGWLEDKCTVRALREYLAEVVVLRQQMILPLMRWAALTQLLAADESGRRRVVSSGSEPCLILARRVKEVTDDTVSELDGCLKERGRSGFPVLVEARAFPLSFPDRDDAIALAIGVQTYLDSTDPQSTATASAREAVEDYLSSRAEVNKLIRQVELDGQEFVFVLRGLYPDELNAQRMDLMLRRKELHESFVEQMQSILGDEGVSAARRFVGTKN